MNTNELFLSSHVLPLPNGLSAQNVKQISDFVQKMWADLTEAAYKAHGASACETRWAATNFTFYADKFFMDNTEWEYALDWQVKVIRAVLETVQQYYPNEQMLGRLKVYWRGNVDPETSKHFEDEDFGFSFAGRVTTLFDGLRDLLIEKNKAYGNSALDPLNVFAQASAVAQLQTQIDHKLSRIKRGSEFQGEDTLRDLIGYLGLLLLAREDANDVK